MHNWIGGILTVIPASSARSLNSSRNRELAVNPPPATIVSTPSPTAAATAFAVRESFTDSENPAAMSAGDTSSLSATKRETAVFSPEKEKS